MKKSDEVILKKIIKYADDAALVVSEYDFNKPDEYLLAIVEVDGGGNTATVYLKKPFRERPDFAATSVNYDIADLTGSSEVVLCTKGKEKIDA
ncbi:MAG: hypothetical protein LBH21_00880 [Gracilibacteraceae bacterium]|jgi:hypothetical protein|nr:hypothetical protein [Gracilibacteraceae bacterium]